MKKIVKTINLFIINHFLSGTHFFRLKRILLNLSGIKIGKDTKIVGPLDITGYFEVGNNCWIGKKMSIYGNGKVIIGDNCDIAPNVSFYTGSHKIGNWQRRAGKGLTYDIKIEDGCWICGGACFINAITIHNSSIVGASSLVNKDVISNSLVGGVPAKVIKKLDIDKGDNKNE